MQNVALKSSNSRKFGKKLKANFKKQPYLLCWKAAAVCRLRMKCNFLAQIFTNADDTQSTVWHKTANNIGCTLLLL